MHNFLKKYFFQILCRYRPPPAKWGPLQLAWPPTACRNHHWWGSSKSTYMYSTVAFRYLILALENFIFISNFPRLSHLRLGRRHQKYITPTSLQVLSLGPHFITHITPSIQNPLAPQDSIASMSCGRFKFHFPYTHSPIRAHTRPLLHLAGAESHANIIA